ncbi:WD40-repeat-containing domain protein [Globomyces pollinis-pini]|nr:WD40-repeat-containing domain protein [Globomyces pollinis-pini]
MNTAVVPPTNTKTLPTLPSTPSKNLKKVTSDVNVMEFEPKTYVLEDVNIPDDGSDEDDLEFEEIPVEPFDEASDSDVEETLEQAVRNMHEKGAFGVKTDKVAKADEPTMELVKHPEVIDDFIRNYLSSKGLLKSLDAFQNEWYEFQQADKIPSEVTVIVPDIYQQNQKLSDSVSKLKIEVDFHKDIAVKARATYDKLRKERDFHRMHHKRVVQEKLKLISDIKKLKKHYEEYEPALKQLQNKYEAAMKEKMLTKLERDRLSCKVTSLEQNVKNLERVKRDTNSANSKKVNIKDNNTNSNVEAKNALTQIERVNPYATMDLPQAKPDRFRPIQHIQGHSLAISSVKFHPKKPILATVSDDKTWKLWAFPSCELIMSGQGHQDWIADCDFHPKGNQLATASGDSTVKLWDFSKGIATSTLSDHTQAVWSCAFHDQGQYLISGSMDHTAKLWDLNLAKCKQTFRGHAESVNHVGFQPFSNILYTCSGDKTISFWDSRTGLCSQTLYGHGNTINHGGNWFASCDADGIVKFWDLRMTSELDSIDTGTRSANKLAFDPSGTILGVTTNSGTVKLINTNERSRIKDIKVNEDSVQAIVFDSSAEYMVVTSNDGGFHIYQ